jgi:glycosyltransferase involved in cell wall biosynthesis
VSKRKILVFAHVPPPHHGQSVMVQVMLEGLRADARFEVYHVDARVSDDLEDVGSFRPAKFWRLFQCIAQAWWIRLRYGRMAFYYVPAPAKRSAIMRDWVVMVLCRPWFPELILHWHAYGLGEWVAAGKDWQRKLTRWVLGKADLSIVLNNYNKRDAEVFAPKRIAVVPNGIEDLFPDYETALAPRREARAVRLRHLGLRRDKEDLEIVRFLFLGHLIETKGVFVAIEAAGLANEELRERNAPWRAHLTLAGSFASEEEKGRVLAAMEKANKISHGLKKMGEDRSTRLADARTGGDALCRVTPAQGGFVTEEIEDGRLEMGEGGADPGGRGAEGGDRRLEMGEGVCVELAGFLGAKQKKSALEEADCLVFPTFYENEAQPLVLLEAMSAGLPVITTSWRGVAEAFPEGYGYLVEPQNVQETAQAIKSACNSDSASHLLRELFQKKYTVERHAAKLADAMLLR